VTPVQRQGLFLVTKASKYVKAYSWTLHRRPGAALKLALNRAWEEWQTYTGFRPVRRFIDEIEKIPDEADFSVLAPGTSAQARL
jgi:hypothetical protein